MSQIRMNNFPLIKLYDINNDQKKAIGLTQLSCDYYKWGMFCFKQSLLYIITQRPNFNNLKNKMRKNSNWKKNAFKFYELSSFSCRVKGNLLSVFTRAMSRAKDILNIQSRVMSSFSKTSCKTKIWSSNIKKHKKNYIAYLLNTGSII